jgi:hypothetical protein
MYAFEKVIRNAKHTRRYTIRTVDSGWEVITEEDNRSLRRVHYDDWHRVERAQRSIEQEVEALARVGWTDDAVEV